MPSFVQIAEEKIRLQAYQDTIRFNSDVDSFAQESQLTLDQARAIMKDLHDNNIEFVQIVGPLTVTLHVGQTIQFRALAHRSKGSINIPTIGAQTEDVSSIATWVLNPAGATVTVLNGLVTAAVVGVVQVYAKLGDLVSVASTITVAA